MPLSQRGRWWHRYRRVIAGSTCLIGLSAVAAPLSAQSSADSSAVMQALADYMLDAVTYGQVAVRAGFDARIGSRPAIQSSLAAPGEGAARSLVRRLGARGVGRLQIISPKGPPADTAASHREAAYSAVFTLGRLSLGADSAKVSIALTVNYRPQPSTFSESERLLHFVRSEADGWVLARDEILLIADGYYDFAPLENLPPSIRAAEQHRRTKAKPPGE